MSSCISNHEVGMLMMLEASQHTWQSAQTAELALPKEAFLRFFSGDVDAIEA